MPIRGAVGKKGNLYVEYELVLPERVEGDMLKGECGEAERSGGSA